MSRPAAVRRRLARACIAFAAVSVVLLASGAGVASATSAIVVSEFRTQGVTDGGYGELPNDPGISGLTLSPRRIRPLRSGPSVVPSGGAAITFTAPIAETVKFTVRRAVKGRRVGGVCRRRTRANRRRRSCTRYVAVRGSFSHAAKVGANSLRFSGRVGGKRLARGRYRLVATPLAPNGVQGIPAVVNFRIV